MKYAVVKIGASQYKVAEGDEIAVEKLDIEKGDPVELDQVLLVAEGEKYRIGQPLVSGVIVKAKVLDQTKGKKIRVATYKAKSRYRRVIGHRKLLTKIRIESIGNAAEAKTPKNAKKKAITTPIRQPADQKASKSPKPTSSKKTTKPAKK